MKRILILPLLGAFALAGCDGMTSDQRYATGALAGGAAGLAVADRTGADDTGKAIGVLAGAAAGGAIASGTGSSTKQCRYSDGTIAPCPAGY